MTNEGAVPHPHTPPQQNSQQRPSSIVVTLGPGHPSPWWWSEVDHRSLPCDLSYARLVYKGKTSRELSSLEMPMVFIKVLRLLLAKRAEGIDYIYTFECDLVGWAIAFWQTILPIKRPKHVILQFIMRELQPNLRSRAKYAVMRFLLSSVHKVVCSSTIETGYYAKVFGWQPSKLVFVPFHTSRTFIEYPISGTEGYIVAAGRSFRDYDTLINSVKDSDIKTLIIGDKGCSNRYSQHGNVTVMENIPQDELARKLSRAMIVVLPLQDREISTGQTVLLQAMAMGKPVIATRTSGTIDYIEHGKTGLLVSPGDAVEMRAAIDSLLQDRELRIRIGESAKKAVAIGFLPKHYAQHIARLVAV